jgi:hypothetical protein
VVAPQTPDEYNAALMSAFNSVDVFRRVVEHFGGSKLPENPFLANTLETTFGIDPEVQAEFVDIFQANCRLLGIGADFDPSKPGNGTTQAKSGQIETVATPRGGSDKVCFIIMPFT